MSEVSVIIPSYNRKQLIARAIDSVLAQSHRANEIIVVDDGSTDGTDEFVANNYPDIRFIRQINKGISAARNRGINAARGNWLALLDSDDEWLPEKLKKQLAALEQHSSYRLVHSNEIWIRKGARVNQMKKHQKFGGHIYQHCLPLCAISPSSAVIHHSIFDSVGLFDETLPVCEDYDMWLRITARFPILFLDNELIIKHGGHADQLSKKYWGMDRFRIRAINKSLNSNQLSREDEKAAITTLISKINIYLKGARKHNNSEFTDEFKQLLKRYTPLLDDMIITDS